LYLKRFTNIITIVFAQISGFLSAVFGYESFKIMGGAKYEKGIWGLDIPLIYQTGTIYKEYCFFLFIWFLVLCFTGVIAATKRKIYLAALVSILCIASLFLIIYLNGRYAI